MSVMLAAMVGIGLWDQHPRVWRPDYAGLKREWTQDADFVSRVEAALPPAAMVLQLPYVKFPEAPPVHQYDAAQGVRFSLHSNSLRWSCGAVMGREADAWQQRISELPLEEQVQAAVTAGFQGIQVNRKGYPDQGQDLERRLQEQLGVEPIVSENGVDSFFPLSPRVASLNAGQF
jgi:phosphoglycerol transferase